MSNNKQINTSFLQEISKLISNKDNEEIIGKIKNLHVADIAEILKKLSSEQSSFLFQLIDEEKSALVLIEVEDELREYLLSSLSGFKNLNGSQLVKENITFILNSLKFKINEIEKDKTILHIFNSKFILDKKEIKNLPIGLFGNFYSHELSFFLIDNNDYNNLQNIFAF